MLEVKNENTSKDLIDLISYKERVDSLSNIETAIKSIVESLKENFVIKSFLSSDDKETANSVIRKYLSEEVFLSMDDQNGGLQDSIYLYGNTYYNFNTKKFVLNSSESNALLLINNNSLFTSLNLTKVIESLRDPNNSISEILYCYLDNIIDIKIETTYKKLLDNEDVLSTWTKTSESRLNESIMRNMFDKTCPLNLYSDKEIDILIGWFLNNYSSLTNTNNTTVDNVININSVLRYVITEERFGRLLKSGEQFKSSLSNPKLVTDDILKSYFSNKYNLSFPVRVKELNDIGYLDVYMKQRLISI